MLRIKIVKNGVESAWFEVDTEEIIEIIKDNPDSIFAYAQDLYPETPDCGEVMEMTTEIFEVVVRESYLLNERQKKQDQRHLDLRSLEELRDNDPALVCPSPEDEYFRMLRYQELWKAMDTLTHAQRNRLLLNALDELSLREISEIDGAHFTTIGESIRSSKKKIRKILK